MNNITIPRKPRAAMNISREAWEKISSTFEPPYKCKECGQEAPSFSSLNMHFQRKHGKIKGSPVSMKREKEAAAASYPQPALGGEEPPAHASNGHAPNGTGARTRKRKTRWDDEDRTLIHEQIMEIWLAHPDQGLTVALVNKAQHKILPAERWRSINQEINAPEVWERARKAMREIIEKSQTEPLVMEKIVEVRAPVDLDKVLHSAPLEKLAAVLAERTMQMQMAFLEAGGRGPSPAPAPPPLAAQGVMDPQEVQGLLPRVQVIGFRRSQHEVLLQNFKDHPVIILQSIDAATPPDFKLLAEGATWYLMDRAAPIDGWRKLINEKVSVDRRATMDSAGRIHDRIKQIATDFILKNKAAADAWRTLHFKEHKL